MSFSLHVALLALPLQSSFQQPGDPEAAPQPRATVIVEGQVLLPSGATSAGALVTSSAGGRTHTDAAGRFRIELVPSADAEELELIALAPPELSATARLSVAGAADALLASPLRLEVGLGCSPDWLPFQEHGLSGAVNALAVHDDGSGAALYAGGEFHFWVGTELVNYVARWDGLSWTGMAANTPPVSAMISFDDGGGAKLYIATLTHTRAVLRWSGSHWEQVGDGFQFGDIKTLAAFDDGSGPKLYAGGYFSSIGGVTARGVARWNGSAWTRFSTGLGSGTGVEVLHVFDPGSGPTLFAGGKFETATGLPAGNIALWSTAISQWWPLTGGGVEFGGKVNALATFDDGAGPALYVGGAFSALDWGTPVNNVAKWNGLGWTALGTGVNGAVEAFAVYENWLNQPALYAAGAFTSAGGVPAGGLAHWRGVWTGFAGATSSSPRTMLVHDDGTPGSSMLFIGGDFEQLCGRRARRIAKCDVTEVFQVVNGPSWTVDALALFDDGRGTALYAGGNFTSGPLESIGRFDGLTWEPLGSGIGGTVNEILVHDDGSGSALYVGGGFLTAGGVPASNIARWDGASWSAVGGGMDNDVRDLLVHDDGSGPALYAAGWFTTAGGVSAPHVAKWDGLAWTSLAGGTNGILAGHALCTYDDGGGPDLYLGGSFTAAGGVPASRIARWDGTAWSALGAGMGDGAVWALHVHDDGLGGGPALYATGNFTTAGAFGASRIAKWNGLAWSGLGSGFNDGARVMATYDDGTGGPPALFVGGNFLTAGGIAVTGFARWDGAAWSAPGAGLEANFPVASASVNALLVHDDGGGDGPTLHVGGHFTYSPEGDSYITRWGGCAETPPPACSASVGGPTTLTLSECGHLLGVYELDASGSTSGGTWQVEPGPGFPNGDGWTVELVPPTSSQTAHLLFGAVGSTTTGSWPVELRWSGSCNGLPATWSKTVTCRLQAPYPGLGEPYCFGDGTAAPCPCANGLFGCRGCRNSSGNACALTASGSTSVAAGNLVLHGAGAAPAQAGLFFQGTQRVSSGNGIAFGDGLRCAGGSTRRLQVRTANGSGASSTTVNVALTGNVSAGDTRTYQLWYRDPSGSPCGTGFNFSNGLELVWEP